MSRISIDVSTEDHQKLKALAALQGKSIKDYVLERVLGSPEQDEIQALAELESFLDDRIRRTEQNGNKHLGSASNYKFKDRKGRKARDKGTPQIP